MSMIRFVALLLSAGFLAGCSSGFQYQRKPTPAQGDRKAQAKVAVIAFQDGTEEFTSRGNIIGGYVFNLARTGINGMALNTGAAFSLSPLPAGIWSKHLAEDMDASGDFRSVKLLFSPTEVTDEEIVVEGALTKACFTTVRDKPDEFVLHLKVRRMPGNAVVREGDVGKTGVRPRNLTSGCILGTCVIDRINGYLGNVMQDIFSEFRRDLVVAMGPPPEEKPARPLDTPEDVIHRILGGK